MEDRRRFVIDCGADGCDGAPIIPVVGHRLTLANAL